MNKASFQPADSNDIWLRHLLFETKIIDGELHPKFFQNTFKNPRTEKGQTWALEISGRLLSKTFDVEKRTTDVEPVALVKANELHQKAEQLNRPSDHPWRTASFRGVIYQKVGTIRTIEPNLYDVFPDPSNEDPAHANLVRLEEFPRIKGKISPKTITNLIEKFQVAQPGSPELIKLLEYVVNSQ